MAPAASVRFVDAFALPFHSQAHFFCLHHRLFCPLFKNLLKFHYYCFTLIIGGCSYKLLAHLTAVKRDRDVLRKLPIDEYLQYFSTISMHEFGNHIDSFVQSSASGIVCTLCSFRSIFQSTGQEYDSVFIILNRMIKSPVNLTVFVNAVCAVSQMLLHTFQTAEETSAVKSALKAGIWSLFVDMFHNGYSLLHEHRSAQVAAITSLMYLSQHAELLSPISIEALEMILRPEWKHVHLFAVACVW